jgi:hypothetical protein
MNRVELKKRRKREKLMRQHPVYSWKFSLIAHPDKKRQRKAKIADKAFSKARKMKCCEMWAIENDCEEI